MQVFLYVFVMFRGTFIASHTLENLCKFQVLNVFPATSGVVSGVLSAVGRISSFMGSTGRHAPTALTRVQPRGVAPQLKF